MTKLYVGRLPYKYNDQDLANLFSAYGAVASSAVIKDKMSGRSKGFGFVELDDDTAAQKAILELNGKDVEGLKIVVSVAQPREERPANGFQSRPRR